MSDTEERIIGELVGEMRGVRQELRRLADAVGEQGSRLSRMEIQGCARGEQDRERLDVVEQALRSSGIPILRALVSGGGGGAMSVILLVIALAAARAMGFGPVLAHALGLPN